MQFTEVLTRLNDLASREESKLASGSPYVFDGPVIRHDKNAEALRFAVRVLDKTAMEKLCN